MQQIFDSLREALGQSLLSVLGAVTILIVGWVLATLIRAGIRRGLGWARINDRLRSATGEQINVEQPRHGVVTETGSNK